MFSMRLLWTILAVSFSLVSHTTSARAQPACTCGPECYGTNFADAKKYVWAKILAERVRLPAASKSGGVLSTAGWLIDTNHADYALFVGPLVIWSEPYLRRYPNTIAQGSGIPGCPDLRNATIRLRLNFVYHAPRGEYDIGGGGHPEGARLLFWFQTELRDRIVNYAYDVNLLEDARNGREVPLVLNNPRKWICLGGNRMFAGVTKYGCTWSETKLLAALSAVNVNMGFILILPDYEGGTDGKRLSWLNSVNPLRTPGADGSESRFELATFTIEKALK